MVKIRFKIQFVIGLGSLFLFLSACQSEVWWTLSENQKKSCDPTSQLGGSDEWKKSFSSDAKAAFGCLQMAWGTTSAEGWSAPVKIDDKGNIFAYNESQQVFNQSPQSPSQLLLETPRRFRLFVISPDVLDPTIRETKITPAHQNLCEKMKKPKYDCMAHPKECWFFIEFRPKAKNPVLQTKTISGTKETCHIYTHSNQNTACQKHPNFGKKCIGSSIICKRLPSTYTCEAGTETPVCKIEFNPLAKELCDGFDNNCDGTIDEGCPCTENCPNTCKNGDTQACKGPGKGACSQGTQTCASEKWGICNQAKPTKEICGDNTDNNCDGEVDEGCVTSNSSWANALGGPHSDLAITMTYSPDDKEQVVIAGTFQELIEYDGKQATGQANLQTMFYAKFDPSGKLSAFTKLCAVLGKKVSITSIGFDQNRNMYLSGSYTGSMKCTNGKTYATQSSYSGFIIKLSPKKQILWVRVTEGNQADDVDFGSMAVSSHGNIYIVGAFQKSASFFTPERYIAKGHYDFFVLGMNTSGDSLWHEVMGGNSNNPLADRATSVALSPDEKNIYVVGTFAGKVQFGIGGTVSTTPGNNEAFLLRVEGVSGAITLMNVSRGSSPTFGRSVSVDSKGSIYIMGRFKNSIGWGNKNIATKGVSDFFLVKSSKKGLPVWILSGKSTGLITSTQLTITPQGNGWVGGYYQGSLSLMGQTLEAQGQEDFFVAGFTATGQGTTLLAHKGNLSERVVSLLPAGHGDLFVLGFFSGNLIMPSKTFQSKGNVDIFLLRNQP